MPEVKVTTREGAAHNVDATEGRPLMEALREANVGVEGTCGGECACGTCHVYVAQQWAERLPARSEDEQMMLEAIGEMVEVRPNSRLSCQIKVSEALAGIEVVIAPVP